MTVVAYISLTWPQKMGWNPFSIRNPIFTNHFELFLRFSFKNCRTRLYIYGLKIFVGKFLNFEIMFQFIKTAKNLKKVSRSKKAQKKIKMRFLNPAHSRVSYLTNV